MNKAEIYTEQVEAYIAHEVTPETESIMMEVINELQFLMLKDEIEEETGNDLIRKIKESPHFYRAA